MNRILRNTPDASPGKCAFFALTHLSDSSYRMGTSLRLDFSIRSHLGYHVSDWTGPRQREFSYVLSEKYPDIGGNNFALAQQIGLTIPQSLLNRADKVIKEAPG